MDPIIKWPGGKRWLAPALAPGIARYLMSHPTARYIEPFVGGAAVALEIGSTPFGSALFIPRMTLGDLCEELINVYTEVKDHPRDVHQALRNIIDLAGTTSEGYYHVRGELRGSATQRAARLIYLNKLCYNGLWRVNRRGEFNVPYGKNERPRFPTEADLVAFADVMRLSHFHACDFITTLQAAAPGDVIYVDSPYHATFTQYTKEGFSERDHQDLADALWQLAQSGCIVFATNSATDLVRQLYTTHDDYANARGTFDLVPLYERRAINRDGAGRGAVECLLIASTNAKEACGDELISFMTEQNA